MQRNRLLSLLPPYDGKKKLIVNNQDTEDIIVEVEKAHRLFAKDYDRISDLFWAGNVRDTARNIFSFLKSNVKYSIEPDRHQSTKSPAAIIATGNNAKGFNDCKHYSLFAAGILDSLKRKGKDIDWWYRFANYKMLETTPGHVFVVAKDKGQEIWIDPVLGKFDQKKPFVNAVDKKVNMALYRISGIGKTKAKKAGKPKKRILLKVGAAPARNAFLGLVALNVNQFAAKLYRQLQTNKAALKSKWEKLGGNFSKLEGTIMKAAKKKGIVSGSCVGSVAAALAAAMPIIAALKEFLGDIKGVQQEGAEQVAAMVDTAKQVQATGTQPVVNEFKAPVADTAAAAAAPVPQSMTPPPVMQATANVVSTPVADVIKIQAAGTPADPKQQKNFLTSPIGIIAMVLGASFIAKKL